MAPDSSVVDQEFDWTAGTANPLHGRPHLLAITHVADPGSGSLQFGGGGLNSFAVPIQKCHNGACSGQADGNGATNTLGRATDQGYAPLHTHVAGL